MNLEVGPRKFVIYYYLLRPVRSPEAAENKRFTILRPIVSYLWFLGSVLFDACRKLSYLWKLNFFTSSWKEKGVIKMIFRMSTHNLLHRIGLPCNCYPGRLEVVNKDTFPWRLVLLPTSHHLPQILLAVRPKNELPT